ncbi:MAG TPA: NAD-dependent epimerase/dehydratase family protein [Candidatus Solibacter sp.]|jgi:UDP-glucose 4-epimerase|nr:NAD-dependent epimerase/dehydratase family protein [Candidatus Solibacter sp.]
MKVLVTGGAGFIGSNVADRLVEEGHHVVVLDDLSSGKREQVPAAANFYQMELDGRWLDRVVEREKPDAVCHLAAQISVRRSVEDPVFDARVNILASIGLIEACRLHGVKRFIFTSTGGAIYGDADQVPTPETYPAAPVSPYGTSKLCVEHYLHCFRELYGFSSAALRLANVYGPRQDPHGEAGVVAIFSKALLEGRTATINGDGKQTRDYVYVGDVVEAFALALQSDIQGSYNVGTGTETDVAELYQHIARAAGSSAAAEYGPARPGEQKRSCVDIGLIAERLDWRPGVRLEEGIPLTVEYFRSQIERQVAAP